MTQQLEKGPNAVEKEAARTGAIVVPEGQMPAIGHMVQARQRAAREFEIHDGAYRSHMESLRELLKVPKGWVLQQAGEKSLQFVPPAPPTAKKPPQDAVQTSAQPEAKPEASTAALDALEKSVAELKETIETPPENRAERRASKRKRGAA